MTGQERQPAHGTAQERPLDRGAPSTGTAGGREAEPDPVVRAQELRVAIGRVTRRMRQLYASNHGAGPSFTEAAVLARLDREGPATPTELASRERVTAQAIATVIRDLEDRALITRPPARPAPPVM